MDTLSNNLYYSAKLTGNTFLCSELKTVAYLKHMGLSDTQIKDKVIEENLFNYKTRKSILKRLGAVLSRIKALDEPLIEMLYSLSSETGKLITLYSILKTDRLFFEFMKEVIYEKYRLNQFELSSLEVGSFFHIKAEQSDIVAKWREVTMRKLAQVYLKILIQAGLLKKNRTFTIIPQIIPQELSTYLKNSPENDYIHLLLGDKF